MSRKEMSPATQQLVVLKSNIEKRIVGKGELIDKLLIALISEGHVLLDDVPGVGKTTLAVAVSRAVGLDYRRV